MVNTAGVEKATWILTLASVAVVVGALYLAKGILLPLILAGLISFLLSPVCDSLERYRLGRIPAVLVTVVLTFLGLGVIAATAISQMGELAPKLTEYQSNVEAKIRTLQDSVGTRLRGLTRTTQKITEQIERAERNSEQGASQAYAVRLVETPPTVLELFGDMFGTVLEILATAGIVIILVLFFLVRREDLRDRFIRLVGQGQVTGTTQALQDAASRVSRYLLAQLLINLVFGIAVTISLYLIGVPNAILWGILTAVLKFIPYIGVWIAAAAPTCLSLAISDGWFQPLLAFGIFTVLEFIVGNFLEPWLFGKHTGVSAVAILVAAVFWSWLWGGVGLLLATPLTVCLLVLGKYVPQLAFLDVILGDEPVFDWKTRVYQRLLAGDLEEASDLVEQFSVNKSLVEVYDTLLIPTLSMAEKDRHRGEIDLDRLDFIWQGLRTIVEDLGETQRQYAAAAAAEQQGETTDSVEHGPPVPNPLARRIVCLSAFSEADEIVALMVEQLAQLSGSITMIVSVKQYAKLTDPLFDGFDPDLVCISAMPPAAVARARSALRKVLGRVPQAKLVIGLWNYEGDIVRAAKRVGCSPSACVVSTLQVALEPLLAPPATVTETGLANEKSGFVPMSLPALSH